jgi:transposase-like protein
MFKLVETFLTSGKTQKKFCRQHEISLSKFQFWLRLYRREKQPVPIEQAKTERAFIPIHFSSKDQCQDLEYTWSVEYPNGVRIRFSGRPDMDMILGLVHLHQAV